MSNPDHVVNESLSQAATWLQAGEVVAIPTETVYGLAADIYQPAAVKKIFALKGRPTNHPLIIHIGTTAELSLYAKQIPAYVEKLLDHFWPGPLTFVLPKTDLVDPVVTGGQNTVAIRMPAHPLTLALLQTLQHPVAAPSANKFGKISPTCANHVLTEFGPAVKILDGGPCTIGIESTIIDATQLKQCGILREGGICAQMLREVLGTEVNLIEKPHYDQKVSGRLKKHYSPNKPLLLFSNQQELAMICKQYQRPYLLYFSPEWKAFQGYQMPTNETLYAQQLYHQLRLADALDSDIIAVEHPPHEAKWAAIIDRLLKAQAVE